LILDLEHILSEIFPELVIEDVNSETLKQKDSISREKLEILFAEDSPTMRRGVISALKKAGFENITDFVNGEQALSHIMEHYKNNAQHSLEKVVLISDIEMPRMDGLTLCRSIKQDPDLNAIHVIMFSSIINSQMVSKCEKVNADGYVTKPETNQLIQILDSRCR
jgi:two-component system chemotaxis response regulator CheV